MAKARGRWRFLISISDSAHRNPPAQSFLRSYGSITTRLWPTWSIVQHFQKEYWLYFVYIWGVLNKKEASEAVRKVREIIRTRSSWILSRTDHIKSKDGNTCFKKVSKYFVLSLEWFWMSRFRTSYLVYVSEFQGFPQISSKYHLNPAKSFPCRSSLIWTLVFCDPSPKHSSIF